MCGLESVGDLARERERLIQRNGAAGDPARKRFPFDQLHDECQRAVELLGAINLSDVRVTQRREQLRFPLKSRHTIRIVNEARAENLDRDLSGEPRIPPAIALTHATRATNGLAP